MKTQYFLSAAALLAACPAAAQTTALGPTALGEIVVTATRTPERADHVGSQVTVLDRAEIEAQQSPAIPDLLARTPGVSVSRNGGVGGATQLRIRGAESEQTVVLIDGVKLNDPSATGGGFNFANLLTGDLERIEVLRGAQSVLWGSQAIGGVVNLITADPAGAFEARADAEAGSLGTAYLRGAVGGKTERLTWRAAAGWYTSDGISAFDERLGGAEKDGYRNLGLSAKARVQVTETISLDLRSLYSRGRTEFDGFPAPRFVFADTREYGITRDWVSYAGLNLDLFGGRLANRLAFARTETNRDNFNPDQAVTTRTFDAAGTNSRLEYQGTWKLTDDWTAVFGAEHERSWFRSASPTSTQPNPTPGRRTSEINGAYALLRGQPVEGLTLGGGLRVDDHREFGSHVTGQISAAWRLGEATLLRASWGEGFKAPSLFQLGSEFGNAALRPESARTWDAGVEQRFVGGRVQVSAAYFQRRTKDQIDFVSCAATSTNPLCIGPTGRRRSGFYDNISRAEARGIELQGQAQVTESLTLSANYTWTQAENDSSGNANRGKRLVRRPRNQGYAEASYRWPAGVTTAVAVRYLGDSFDDAANRNRIKGAVLWDLRTSWQATETVEVYGRVENLFDEAWSTIRNYGQPGRTAYAGVRAKF
jgi:vitamin B12 transporter